MVCQLRHTLGFCHVICTQSAIFVPQRKSDGSPQGSFIKKKKDLYTGTNMSKRTLEHVLHGVYFLDFVWLSGSSFHFNAYASIFTALCFSDQNSLLINKEKAKKPNVQTLHVFSIFHCLLRSPPKRPVCLPVCLPNAITPHGFPAESPGLLVKTRWSRIEFLMFLSRPVLPRVYTDRLM